MKRIWTLLLCSVFLLSMTACGSSAPKDSSASNENSELSNPNKIAVVCFSGTGNTMEYAKMIADITGADLFEIIPSEEYTREDLNYRDENCRANMEQNNPDARPEIKNDLSAIKGYKTIYLGHPLWWGTNPRIIQTLLDKYDLSGATIYTFCTSGGSSIERSISDLQTLYPDLKIVTGKRLNNASEDDVKNWIDSLPEN